MKKILITGASSGIGLAIAQKLANNAYELICCVRKEEDKIKLENIHKNIECVFLDVTDENKINELYNNLKTENIELCGIVNNAGYASTGLVEYPNIDDIKMQFDVNSFAPLKIATTFLPLMTKGKIINISSVSSNFVYPFLSPYCASKKILDIFFQGLAIEMNNPDIKIVSIKPGVIKTPLWDKSLKIAEENFNKLPEIGKQKYRPYLEKMLAKVEISIKNGLEVDAVSNRVLQVMNSRNPRASYNVGIGSYIGEFLSKLSVDLQRKLIKFSF